METTFCKVLSKFHNNSNKNKQPLKLDDRISADLPRESELGLQAFVGTRDGGGVLQFGGGFFSLGGGVLQMGGGFFSVETGRRGRSTSR